jgi:DNA helicase-2/ATP-dependent DNA helicase PcrA
MGAQTTGPRARALCGGRSSGKTAALATRVAELLAGGVPAADVLVLTPGVDGALALGRRLAAALGEGAELPRVRSARSLALEALGAGRRVLLDVEESLLAADLHAAGLDAASVRRALANAAGAWHAGADPAALADPAVDAALAALAARGCVTVDQLPCEAARALAADPDLRARLGAAHVLVDDANALSPAALRLARALAGAELLMAGDPSWAPTLFDRGAQADAFVRLAEAAGGTVEQLACAPRRLAARTAYAVKWGKASGELLGMRNYVRRLFDVIEDQTGTVGLGRHDQRTKEDLLEVAGEDVFVVAPNRSWAHAFAEKLEAADVPTTLFLAKQPLACDPRRAKTNGALKAFVALGLAARPRDASLWRTWCAFDAADLACAPWLALERCAAGRGENLVSTLEAAAAGEVSFEGSDRLAEAWRAGSAQADAARRHRGFALVKRVDPAASAEFSALTDPMAGDEDAAALFARVYENALDRRYDDDRRKVRVGCAESLLGLAPRYVVALGFNDGLVNLDDAPAALHALGAARDELVVSHIQWAPVETAEKLGLATRRTRVEDGQRVAVLMASPVLRLLGDEVPSTLSGQQFCSCVLDMRV